MDSLFHLCSVGYAAENLPFNTRNLNVFPPEMTPYANGEVHTGNVMVEDEGVDAFGQKYKVKAELSNCIAATWLPMNSNRLTPPNVRRGERVLIWQYADVDQYYWTTSGLDDYLRRLETVVYAWSNTRDETVKALTADKCYFFEISTHRKLVTFSTSKSDGEPYRYMIQINTKDGRLSITDDAGNFIDLNSSEKRIRLENSDGTKIHLDKRTISGEALDSITWTTKKFTVNSQEATINGTTSFDVVSPQSTFSAKVDVMGLLTMHAGMSAAAAPPGTPPEEAPIAEFKIDIKSTNKIETDADVKAGAISLSTHKHPNPEGGQVGGPV
jgi:hypothetical protein